MTFPRHVATRYVQPLREGGSLPAVVDTEDGGLYVVKFRGAGQGARALVAELLVGALAIAIGLPVPELALVEVTPEFGRTEPDPEIQELLRRSHGMNVGLRYLDGAFNFDATAAADLIDVDFASRLVWLDSWLTNPDRTHRNPNLLVWQRKPWLIDHGTALYAHHDWASVDAHRTRAPFPRIAQHVLITRAERLEALDDELATAAEPAIATVLASLPDELLLDPVATASERWASADAMRDRYREYLAERLRSPRAWVEEAAKARAVAQSQPPTRLKARR